MFLLVVVGVPVLVFQKKAVVSLRSDWFPPPKKETGGGTMSFCNPKDDVSGTYSKP